LLAEKLIACYHEWNWQVDLAIPVPLGVARLSERGYNQAALLARPLALYLGIPYRPIGLIRLRETRSQVGLSYEQRLENVRDAFSARKEIVAGKKVLIVDDVATSSATIDTCAQAILASGGIEVYGLTVARAGIHEHVSDTV
jgi:ComF family protein